MAWNVYRKTAAGRFIFVMTFYTEHSANTARRVGYHVVKATDEQP